jgi:[ribosomal protein S18]-alanine N-acetyltransferase
MLTIRRAILKDINTVYQLEKQIFADKDAFSYDQVRYYVHKSPTTYTWLILHEGQAIGYFVLKPQHKYLRIYSIGVVKPNIGAGSTALSFIEERAQKLELNGVMLEVREDNVQARAFYEKNGYQAYAKEYKYYEDGMDAMLYKKELITNASEAAETMPEENSQQENSDTI